MSTKSKAAKANKPQVKLKDIKPKKEPKGGRVEQQLEKPG